MPRKVDLVGQKFGRLTVIADSGERRHRSVVWECKCDCGASHHVMSYNLINGTTRSCGCLRVEAGVRRGCNLAGQRFGRLTVVGDSGERRANSIVWDCQCDCGASHKATTHSLTSGQTRSCGCLGREQRRTSCDLTGQKFGRLTVVADSGERRGNNIVWECSCDCGTTVRVPGGNLRSGRQRSCGCLRRELLTARNTTHGLSGTVVDIMLVEARARARQHGLHFAITHSDIRIPGVCPALGIPIVKGAGITHDGSPTLDRLRPDQGYVPGNVVVISHLANTIKQNCTSAQVRAVGEWMRTRGL